MKFRIRGSNTLQLCKGRQSGGAGGPTCTQSAKRPWGFVRGLSGHPHIPPTPKSFLPISLSFHQSERIEIPGVITTNTIGLAKANRQYPTRPSSNRAKRMPQLWTSHTNRFAILGDVNDNTTNSCDFCLLGACEASSRRTEI